jgi:glycosyltransferase involved in cell wall biosynthesis
VDEPIGVLIVYPWTSFWSMGEGAGASSFFETARAHVEHGNRVDVVLPQTARDPDADTYHGMHLTRVPLHSDPLAVGPRGPLGFATRVLRYAIFSRKMEAAARRVAEERQPNVVIAMGPHSALIARRIGRRLWIPNVTRLFGQALSLHMDHNGGIRNPWRFYANFPEVIAFRTPCAALIVHDDGSRGDMVARHFRVPDERVYFWRDGIDFAICRKRLDAAACKEALGCQRDSVVGVSIGRLSPEKNLDRIVTVLRTVAPDAPHLEFAFIGDGPSRSDLQAMVHSAGLGDRVHFAGIFVREDLHRVFSAADFLLSVSDRTNMTNAVLEAMAAGIPVVALDTGNTSSVVRHEGTGLLVGPHDTEGLGLGILRLVRDDSLRLQLGSRAQACVESEFESVRDRARREVELVRAIARGERHGIEQE